MTATSPIPYPYKAPPGFYYDPHTRDFEPVLTEEQVRSMWPYANPKKENMNPDPNLMAGFTKSTKPEGFDSLMEEVLETSDLRAANRGELLEVPVVDDTYLGPRFLPLKARNRHDPERDGFDPKCCEICDDPGSCTFCHLAGEAGPYAKAPTEADCLAIANVLTAPERGVSEETLRDMVTLPEHYARFKVEPIRFICENGLNFFQGNILKYILRFDAKNGLEDLKKAQRYLTMFIRFVEKDPDWWRQ